MTTFNIALSGDVMTIGFGAPASNDQIVKDVKALLDDLAKSGKLAGPVLKVTGPASLPVSFVIAHAVCHLFGAVAVFDPKLGKFVVAISHSPDFAVGDLI